MSVAASTTTETKNSSQPMSLWAASLVGAIYVLASLAVVFYAIPRLWEESIDSFLTRALSDAFNKAIRGFVQIAALVGLTLFGSKLAGDNPPKGIRGGITLAISSIFTAFFLIKAVLQIVERMMIRFELGQVASLMFVAFCIFLFWKFLKSDRMQRWSVALEAAGWFDAHSYKPNQGVRVRRLTILGIFLVFGSGVYTMIHNNIISNENWEVIIPFTGDSDAQVRHKIDEANRVAVQTAAAKGTEVLPKKDDLDKIATGINNPDRASDRHAARQRLAYLRSDRSTPDEVKEVLQKIEPKMYVTLLPNIKFTIPMILIALIIWLSWRMVNYPVFADFLIATEAEINKVSWTPRAKLVRDTIVVLVTVFIITFFLFIVDIFWGFLLSRSWIGVLPSEEEKQQRTTQQVNPNEW